MKVAICLSGHFRNYELTSNSLMEYVVKPLNADVFIHTWDKLGYHNNFKPDSLHLIVSQFPTDKITKIYQPKKIVVESDTIIQKLVDESKVYAPHLSNEPKSPGHIASMYYKIMMCNLIRKNYEFETKSKYDCVIRCRPDMLFQSKIEKHNLINMDKIHIPLVNSFNGVNDQFAYSSGQNMDVYSELLYSIPTYFKSKREYYPEKILKWYLGIVGLTIAPINLKYKLVR